MQKLPLIGNVVVSVLVASNILILELFDPAISFNNTAKQFTYLFVFFSEYLIEFCEENDCWQGIFKAPLVNINLFSLFVSGLRYSHQAKQF